MPLTNYGEVLNHTAAVAAAGITADSSVIDCAGIEVERALFEVQCDQAWELYVRDVEGSVANKVLLPGAIVTNGRLVGSGPATGGAYSPVGGLFTAGHAFVTYVKNVGGGATVGATKVRVQVGD